MITSTAILRKTHLKLQDLVTSHPQSEDQSEDMSPLTSSDNQSLSSDDEMFDDSGM